MSKISVRINPTNRKLSQCADVDSVRYSMSHALIIPVKKLRDLSEGAKNKNVPPVMDPVREVYAAVTDARVLAIARIDGLATTEAQCPAKMLDPVPSTQVKTVELNGRWCEKTTKLKDLSESVRVADPGGKIFPKIESVLPDQISENAVVIRLDAQLLLNLASALSPATKENPNPTLTLIVSDSETPVAAVGRSGFGLIMPLECESEEAEKARFLRMRNEFIQNREADDLPERVEMAEKLLNPE